MRDGYHQVRSFLRSFLCRQSFGAPALAPGLDDCELGMYRGMARDLGASAFVYINTYMAICLCAKEYES